MKTYTQEQLLRKFSKIPDVTQCEILENSLERYYALKSRNDSKLNRSHLLHSALLFSLEAHYHTLHLGSAKKHSKELTTLEEKFNMQIKVTLAAHKKKKVTKSSKLLGHYAPLVYRLVKEEHFSFPKVKAFLAKHHSFKVDHTLIARLYPNIKQKVEDLKYAVRQVKSDF
ncbi:hypothetical protein SMUL_1591 [Sulfurospirillum multivorans DSM 12446]|uniref:Uncharacterized protein n=4 Tax=Sulfurospirillum TaxID=57665 RepID=A0A1D7TJZ5_9BACT|nr:hypothetical protein [Sulfurospirillum diekertiae]AHJ12851.1 hypothetical protein SMUL_1591 [Sulfurospirillum multivorans DSM 12446]AOO65325.1 hypothetical protein SHALO_1550 [Sulfurospirillum halorespirans DSM 13726]